MKLLIVLPIKSHAEGAHYPIRWEMCKSTWLASSPVDYYGYADAELGLTTFNQHDNQNDPIRTLRQKRITEYTLDHGYDYMFRTDTDSYVWVNRLLACGFERHDYMGWCTNYSLNGHKVVQNTAHGGVGFFLSRRAMEVVASAPVCKTHDGRYWGDIWAGQMLYDAGIHCRRDRRFLDGSSGDRSMHDGNISADELPMDHQYISIHPVPFANMQAIHDKFKDLPAATVEPRIQIWGER